MKILNTPQYPITWKQVNLAIQLQPLFYRLFGGPTLSCGLPRQKKIFTANQIFNEQKRFSIILNALELKHVKKVQDVFCQQELTRPYQALREALIKRCKINENERLNTLFNQTELGDKKSSELL